MRLATRHILLEQVFLNKHNPSQQSISSSAEVVRLTYPFLIIRLSTSGKRSFTTKCFSSAPTLPMASCQGPRLPLLLHLSIFFEHSGCLELPSLLSSSYKCPLVKFLPEELSEPLLCPWPFLLCSFL